MKKAGRLARVTSSVPCSVFERKFYMYRLTWNDCVRCEYCLLLDLGVVPFYGRLIFSDHVLYVSVAFHL